jgi:hypothetical protein
MLILIFALVFPNIEGFSSSMGSPDLRRRIQRAARSRQSSPSNSVQVVSNAPSFNVKLS